MIFLLYIEITGEIFGFWLLTKGAIGCKIIYESTYIEYNRSEKMYILRDCCRMVYSKRMSRR